MAVGPRDPRPAGLTAAWAILGVLTGALLVLVADGRVDPASAGPPLAGIGGLVLYLVREGRR